ncbi:MAG: hypothetical protein PHW69_02675 [Elusimicrobiaceae bacterium]|nr:hypothetical protein [Elusimicrobiaceae bacterium]
MDNIACRIIEIRADLDALRTRAEEFNRDLNGNGKPGLKTELADLKTSIAVIDTKIALYSAIGSLVGSGLMAAILKKFGG